MSRSIIQTKITTFTANNCVESIDHLAAEEPLEIKLEYGAAHERQQKSLSVTMRTPGHDFELALGFLFTEGIVCHREQVQNVQYCTSSVHSSDWENVVRVRLQPNVVVDWQALERHFYTSSSCGVCGKASIAAVRATNIAPLPLKGVRVAAALIHQLPELLRQEQEVFDYTGGLHAAALFSVSGDLVLMREDVGRHNALDKLIGAAWQKRWLPLHDYLLLVSGRASFELVQKALMAGIPLMAAVGAPSSLAVKLATSFNMTLAGFVRNERYNVYSGVERVSEEVESEIKWKVKSKK